MSVLAVEPSYALSVAPVPVFEPPYDDEVGPQASPGGTLPLPFGTRHLQLVPSAAPSRASRPEDDDDDYFGPQRTVTAQLPEIVAWSHRFVQALLEAVDGRRGFGQISRFVAPTLSADLERKANIRSRMAAARTPGQPVLVRSVRVCDVEDGIAEVSAVVRRGARTLAVALRLEGVDGRWLCTALQF